MRRWKTPSNGKYWNNAYNHLAGMGRSKLCPRRLAHSDQSALPPLAAQHRQVPQGEVAAAAAKAGSIESAFNKVFDVEVLVHLVTLWMVRAGSTPGTSGSLSTDSHSTALQRRRGPCFSRHPPFLSCQGQAMGPRQSSQQDRRVFRRPAGRH
jgi:hypothetical protein